MSEAAAGPSNGISGLNVDMPCVMKTPYNINGVGRATGDGLLLYHLYRWSAGADLADAV